MRKEELEIKMTTFTIIFSVVITFIMAFWLSLTGIPVRREIYNQLPIVVETYPNWKEYQGKCFTGSKLMEYSKDIMVLPPIRSQKELDDFFRNTIFCVGNEHVYVFFKERYYLTHFNIKYFPPLRKRRIKYYGDIMYLIQIYMLPQAKEI